MVKPMGRFPHLPLMQVAELCFATQPPFSGEAFVASRGFKIRPEHSDSVLLNSLSRKAME